MLILERIRVRYRLHTDADPEEVERIHRLHARFCPVARSLEDAIDITTEVELVG